MSRPPNDDNIRYHPTAKKKIVITPIVQAHDPKTFPQFLEGLRRNHGQSTGALSHLLKDKSLGDIHSVVPVYLKDGVTPGFMEVRLDRKPDPTAPLDKGKVNKTYRIFYLGEVSGCANPRDNKTRWCGDKGELEFFLKEGLLIPTNAPALLEAVRRFKSDTGPRPGFFWCEGEKTRIALQTRLDTDYAQEKLKERGLVAVTAATLSGQLGVDITNYRLKPRVSAKMTSTAPGLNDEALDLKCAYHFVVMDADASGRIEAGALCSRLIQEFEVPPGQVILVEPPTKNLSFKGLKEGWDEADPLPEDWTEEQRIDQIFKSVPYEERWVYVTKNKSFVIHAESYRNSKRAIKEIGLSGYFDFGSGETVVTGRSWLGNAQRPSTTEVQNLAEEAYQIMDHQATKDEISNKTWNSVIMAVAREKQRDSIYEEAMVNLERHLPYVTDRLMPDRYLINKGFPDNEYHRQFGYHLLCMRLTLLLRPAFGRDAVTPQLLPIFRGQENRGKSTMVMTFSGTPPTTPKDRAIRFTDNLEFGDLKPKDHHMNLSLFRNVSGKTAVELSDKTTANASDNLAGVLKHFVNIARIEYADLYSNDKMAYNTRYVSFLTSNDEKLITRAMGYRRWPILNFDELTHPSVNEMKEFLLKVQREPTAEERALLLGHNPGLNRVDEDWTMLAYLHSQKVQESFTMEASPAFLELMRDNQQKFVVERNWQEVMEYDMSFIFNSKISAETIGFSRANFAAYIHDRFRGTQINQEEVVVFLRDKGWVSEHRKSQKWFRGENVRIYYPDHLVAAKEVKQVAIWSGMPPRWSLGPDSTSIDRLEKAASEAPPF